jgi:hypothetical protein
LQLPKNKKSGYVDFRRKELPKIIMTPTSEVIFSLTQESRTTFEPTRAVAKSARSFSVIDGFAWVVQPARKHRKEIFPRIIADF